MRKLVDSAVVCSDGSGSRPDMRFASRVFWETHPTPNIDLRPTILSTIMQYHIFQNLYQILSLGTGFILVAPYKTYETFFGHLNTGNTPYTPSINEEHLQQHSRILSRNEL